MLSEARIIKSYSDLTPDDYIDVYVSKDHIERDNSQRLRIDAIGLDTSQLGDEYHRNENTKIQMLIKRIRIWELKKNTVKKEVVDDDGQDNKLKPQGLQAWRGKKDIHDDYNDRYYQ